MMGSIFTLIDEFNDHPTYKAIIKFCLVGSTVLMLGSFATLIVRWNDDSAYIEQVETRLKKCIERFPEYQDRCVIPVTK